MRSFGKHRGQNAGLGPPLLGGGHATETSRSSVHEHQSSSSAQTKSQAKAKTAKTGSSKKHKKDKEREKTKEKDVQGVKKDKEREIARHSVTNQASTSTVPIDEQKARELREERDARVHSSQQKINVVVE
eukprot:SAG31_NODE_4447_length_3223_cov_2.050576_4_plen_130_part_00